MSAPRLVLVHRTSVYDQLLAEHGTEGAVEFFLEGRGQRIEQVRAERDAQEAALDRALRGLPAEWRLASVERAELSRFLFEPDDLIAVVGPDGLVANVAKYLTGQLVVGIAPLRPGPLCSSTTDDLRAAIAGKELPREGRAMVQAVLDDGSRIIALNEVFCGDSGHQSARYDVLIGDRSEPQSSSGLIVGTGTGASGWLASLWRPDHGFALPTPEEPSLAYFVREAWPSATTGVSLTNGRLEWFDSVSLTARGPLVVFGDGVERDRLHVSWGQEVRISLASERLSLAVGSARSTGTGRAR